MIEATRPPADLESLAEGLKSLANPKRLGLLRLLRTPMYLEEIASHLGISRQAAQGHVDQLLEMGLVEKQAGQRETGPVVEYRLVRPRFFALFEDLRSLGAILPEPSADVLLRTQMGRPATAGSRGDLPEVVVVGGLHPGLKVQLHRGSAAPAVSIGRDPSSGLVLDWDLMVSNRHAEVRPHASGHAIVDLFSRNGTQVNGTLIPAGAPAPLRSGDLLQLGRTILVFRE